jgi:hypothetical protein
VVIFMRSHLRSAYSCTCRSRGSTSASIPPATRDTRYLNAVNFLPRDPSQVEFGMAKTVADQFAEILAAVGAKRICGIVGDNLNRLSDTIVRLAPGT